MLIIFEICRIYSSKATYTGLEKTIITDENNIVKLGIEFKNEDKEIFIDFVDYLLNRYYNDKGRK